MTCSTGSTILAWSHAPALVRREPIQLSPGHPLVLVVELKGAVAGTEQYWVWVYTCTTNNFAQNS